MFMWCASLYLDELSVAECAVYVYGWSVYPCMWVMIMGKNLYK